MINIHNLIINKMSKSKNWNRPQIRFSMLNSLLMIEIKMMINKLKSGKAAGIDN